MLKKLNKDQRAYLVEVMKTTANLGSAVLGALGYGYVGSTVWGVVVAVLFWGFFHGTALWILAVEEDTS